MNFLKRIFQIEDWEKLHPSQVVMIFAIMGMVMTTAASIIFLIWAVIATAMGWMR